MASPPGFDIDAGLIIHLSKAFKRDPPAKQRHAMIVEKVTTIYPMLTQREATRKVNARLYNRRAGIMQQKGMTLARFQADDLAACKNFNLQALASKRPHLVIPLTRAEALTSHPLPIAAGGARAEPMARRTEVSTPPTSPTTQCGTPTVADAAGEPGGQRINGEQTVASQAAPEDVPGSDSAPVRTSPRLNTQHENANDLQVENDIAIPECLRLPVRTSPRLKNAYELQVENNIAFKRRKLSQLFFGEESALEGLQRLLQDLLPQVEQLDIATLVAHVARVHKETGKRVNMTAKAVFFTVHMPGFNLLPVKHANHYEKQARETLDKRWTADLLKHKESSEALQAAFKATWKKVSAVQRRGVPRTARSSKSMAEPPAPARVQGNKHMSKICPVGRKAHVVRTGMSSKDQKKLHVNQNTQAGEFLLEDFSHADYGEIYPADVHDLNGTVRDLEIFVGMDCFEHDTPAAWRALGHPPVMRCHCIGVKAWEDRPEDPVGAFDYFVFHDDFSVETFDWDELVQMNLVRVPELYVTEDYRVWWKNRSGDNRELTTDEYRCGFGDARPKHLRTTSFWERV
ncbi:hypothetical protein CYMTET_54985 [Cymbomonas tetramitiformis]|uniref:Uncharacterized protein n=1 Tax=Cymbomonas tetramitiformis TaxID=36881 RepID=A0AAE0BFL3_9CHLO|nr:hypothetical protein CYMTET_54985 [Cymbomonas tetramitiformis]